MALWKKGEDPWDRKPGRDWLNDKKPKEPRENPVENLKAWNEKRKADVETHFRRSPEPCPWCGKDMEQGYLHSGRSSIYWAPGWPTMKSWFLGERDRLLIDTEGTSLDRYKTVWLCRECKKMAFDMPEPQPEYDFFAASETEETKEEEESED